MSEKKVREKNRKKETQGQNQKMVLNLLSHRQRDRETERQKDRKTERQKDRKTE